MEKSKAVIRRPATLRAVRKVREILREKAQEIYEEQRMMIKQAAASGKYEEALKAMQWLLDHAPAEDGERIFDPSVDKVVAQEKPAAQMPTIQIGNFQLGGLGGTVLIDQRLHALFFLVLRCVEPALHGAGDADAGIRHARAEDLDELVDVHLGAGFAQVFGVGGLDLGGVAHARILGPHLIQWSNGTNTGWTDVSACGIFRA